MVRLTGTLSRLVPSRILVIGDLLLDAYTIGKARRISPEAPVAVINVQSEEQRPGGAGNVVLNLVAMGCRVSLVGRVGEDAAAQKLLKNLTQEKVYIRGIVTQKDYPTPVKNRIIADNQQIVRVDHEVVSPLPELMEERVIELLPELLYGVNLIAISDYGKGFLTKTVLANLIDLAKEHNIPVIADPKGVDFTKYAGSTVIKPNLSEAYSAAGLPHDAPLDQVAAKILSLSQSQVLMITRSEAGISLFHRDGGREDFPVKAREVKDVTGAGDTVLATLSCAMASGLSVGDAAQLSNVAAGIAISRIGCACISLSDLARELLEQDVVNKVFDQEHLFALKHALQGHPFNILKLSGEQGFTTAIFNSIRQLSKNHQNLLIYITDVEPDSEFINLLSSLHEVQFIIVNSQSLKELCTQIHPAGIYELNHEIGSAVLEKA
jgi:rfaE bifunctional protein kinase chain/domain